MSEKTKRFRDLTTHLNFEVTSSSLLYVDITTKLNYEVDSFDSSFPMYKVLLDFFQFNTGIDILQ